MFLQKLMYAAKFKNIPTYIPSYYWIRRLSSDDYEKYIPIPPYKSNPNETIETKRSRLLYQSRKRGMLENGLLLSTFADKYLRNLSPDHLDEYDRLINTPSNDWDIYYWVTGSKEIPTEYQTSIMSMLIQHAKNPDKELRIRQPDLKFN